MPPVAGDLAPEIELVDLRTGAHTRLSELHGKVLCWSCGQLVVRALRCHRRESSIHRPLPIASGIEGRRCDRGGGGIDESADLASKRCRGSRLAHQPRPYWSGSDGSRGWESPAAKAYGVSGVPATVLIDREGRVLWRGHPLENLGGQDLAARLEAALKK